MGITEGAREDIKQRARGHAVAQTAWHAERALFGGTLASIGGNARWLGLHPWERLWSRVHRTVDALRMRRLRRLYRVIPGGLDRP